METAESKALFSHLGDDPLGRISAIFLPLTLLAGIYGMNFDVMPELHFPYAYPIALGVMALIAAGLYHYFRANGWLD